MAAKVFLLFPGQGAQTLGMISTDSEQSKSILARAREILGYDLAGLVANGPLDKLNETLYSQPAIYVASWIAFQELQAAKPEYFEGPSRFEIVAAGLSLGEYTALAAAGVISFEDGLRCVHERAQAMHDAALAQEGGMATVIGLSADELARVCAAVEEASASGVKVSVANLLFPGCAVASGNLEALDALDAAAKTAGAKLVRRLPVAGAFHTTAMAPAAERLDAALQRCALRQPEPHVRVFANVTGDLYSSQAAHDIRRSLADQLVSPVMWERTLQSVVDQFREGDVVIELGPGKQLSAMLKRFSPSRSMISALLHVNPGTLVPATRPTATSRSLVISQNHEASNEPVGEEYKDSTEGAPALSSLTGKGARLLRGKPLYEIRRIAIPSLPTPGRGGALPFSTAATTA